MATQQPAGNAGLRLRYMTPRDVPDVIHIDSASFNPPWPARSYLFEINESHISFMLVLEELQPRPVGWLRRQFNHLRGDDADTALHSDIVGYGGLWVIQEEGHISTIASHPDFRGRGYGELLLLAMMRQSLRRGVNYVVLEVRVSNTVAQTLYRKYGFEVIATKENYYRSDNEDAYDMRVNVTPQLRDFIEQRYAALQARSPFVDDYSATPHLRLG